MHIAKLVSRLFKLFIPSIIEEIAKSSGFMKCHSILDATTSSLPD
ncbi:hypothetical protein [Cellulosilyticum ruminicola]|nr:hypothetical protein [Cellulosilyticum ruminicola]